MLVFIGVAVVLHLAHAVELAAAGWICAAVAFLAWFHEAARRFEIASPGFAVAAWFIPAINLLVPCWVMLQLAARAGASAGLVRVWWGSTLVALATARIAPGICLVPAALTAVLVLAIDAGRRQQR